MGYTELDKKNIRRIVINGAKLSGLVTEDRHPDWVGLSFEEMYDRLEQEMEKSDKEMSDTIKVNRKTNSPAYVSSYNDTINALDYDEVSDEELNDLLAQLGGN